MENQIDVMGVVDIFSVDIFSKPDFCYDSESVHLTLSTSMLLFQFYFYSIFAHLVRQICPNI